MAGVKHDPIADIAVISANLRDRYKSGFPILKEIVQNADDAGGSHLSFGYSEGLPGAEHELLKGPAVFFVNDGPLTAADADGILSIALGSKASDENAIGKFGLGMKSLFHLCEAFFYLSDQWSTGDDFHSNVFNPWSHLREPWEIFSKSDKFLIQDHLDDVIKALKDNTETQNWFIVWVPLRKRPLGDDGSIIEYYPGDGGILPDFILDENMGVKLGQLLPLLKGLNSLSIWQPLDGSTQNLQCTSRIKLSDGAVRRQFHGSVLESKLAGKILLESGKEHNQIEYAGYEDLLPDDKFHGVRCSEFWPKSYERDLTTGKERKVEDKAKPHLAIVICQRKTEGRANCHADWSVFLPLGSYPQTERTLWVNQDDKYHTQIFIHGYFFIDAGRVQIHGLDSIGEPLDNIENNDQVRSQWNSLLATEGCLSYLPQAVQNFVEAHNCSAERTQHLSEAIYKSNFVKQHQQWISWRYQWMFQLKKDERLWQLISAESPPLALPNQPKADQSRAWSVFPKLTDLSEAGHVYYDQSQVALLNKNHDGWNDDLLLKVLEIDVSVVFSERTFFAYFNDFLSLAEVKQTEVVKQELFLLARKGLRLSNDKWIKSELTRFLGFIPPGQCVILNKVKLNGLWAELAKLETRLLVIPVDIAPECEKKIFLTVDDARLLLEALDKVLSNESMVKHHQEAQDLVGEIIGLVESSHKERLLKDCSDFRLFKVHDLSKGKDTFLAKSELAAIQNSQSLFRFGLGSERFGFGSALSNALQGGVFYYIGNVNKDLAFDKHVNIPECDNKACLGYIDAKRPLLEPIQNRTQLLKKLSSSNELIIKEKRAFRYLLHGDLEHYNQDSELLLTVATGLNEVWGKLARAVYKAGNDDWRLIDQILIDVLSNKMSTDLDVNKLNIDNILVALKQRVSQIDFQLLNLERDDHEIILVEIEDQVLWKQLPFHETLTGKRIVISEQCYLDNNLNIPPALESQFERIKKSQTKKIAEQQSEWIRTLNQKALIEIILSSTNPHNYYQLILDQLQDLSLDYDLLRLIKESNWLISTNHKTIKPEDVIYIEGLDDEVKRLTAECDAGYYAPDDVHSDIRQHKAYGELKKLFACEKEGLDCLLLMLGESEVYGIGALIFPVDELLTFAELIADDLGMHGWTLLANKKIRALLSEVDESHSNPLEPLLKSLTVGDYQVVLNNLRVVYEQANGNDKSKILKVFNAYLSLIVSCPNAVESLKAIKLLSQKGTWALSEELCVDVEGVDDNYLLNLKQAECLRSVIYSEEQARTEIKQDIVASKRLLLQSTPNTLKTYFKNWDGRIESTLIGFFISLLGNQPEIEELSGNFLVKHSVEGIRNKLDWKVKDGKAIPNMIFLASVVDTETINVQSIFNELIPVRLHDTPNLIIVNHRYEEKYVVSFQLRKLNFDNYTENELSTLLKNSAEFILKKVYEQSCSLEKIWQDLGESDQLDIAVARGLILDELPANLRQLSLQQSELHKSLQDYHNAKSKRKELEITLGKTNAADQEIKDALSKMQAALIDDNETQMAVLQAIKSKIANHQYQNYSVPFELFQNADDAVFEYAEMQAYPVTSNFLNEIELEEQQSQFQVISNKDTLLFVHWGRAINYFRGSEGFPGKERGFHRDLEKMLLMNTSDKQAENQVTGKFGLGFKSVYLISDKPKILSGRLGVEIFAAMLPEPLKESDRSRLKDRIEQSGNTQLSATIIELPLAEEVDQETILKKFNYYAGVLVVFSKTIKHIVFNQKQHVSWREEAIFSDLPEIRKGSVFLYDKKVDAIKFAFRDEQQSCDLLFALGATGFENFPQKIEQEVLPKIWILAPTHDESSIGFLINAGFDVDMGRMQLAHESKNNDQIILHLGKNLARIFEQLDVMIKNDWGSVSKALCLANDVTAYRLWESLWLVLVSSWVRKDDNKIHQLVRSMLTSSHSSFIELLATKTLLPNGLWGDFQQLVRLPDIRYTLKGILSQDKFFKQMRDQLTDFVTAKELIHEDIQGELFKLLSDEKRKSLRWPTFDLASLAEKTFVDKHVSFQLASSWGGIFIPDLLDELDKTEDRKKEKQSLEKVLSSVEFINNEQQFRSVSDLLDSQYGEQEEKLRAAFAPDSSLLSMEYDEKAAIFFRFSRTQLKATIEQMEQWALIASDVKKQIGVLNYLLKGERNNDLANKLRNNARSTWLRELDEQSVHFIGWSKSDITEVLKRKLATDEQMEQLKVRVEPSYEEKLKPEIVLNNIYQWWIQHKETYLDKYSKNIYPEGIFPELFDEDEVRNRDGWMTLLFLASLHTVGRTQDAQHREAIRNFKNKGWWSVFIQEEPEAIPEQWMKVLDEYLQDQFYASEYDAWMMRFVTIYRFSRWLDEYADSWLAIQYQSAKFYLEDVLNTATSSVYAGGGVSAPRLSRTLGIGANFMLRELVRNGVLNGASAIVSSEHCFVPHLRVRQLLNKLGLQLEENAYINQSQKIYEFISFHIGKEKAIFDSSFDIPFQFISRDIQLQQKLFSNTPIESNFVPIDGLMDSPAWAWDLLENIPFFVALVKDNNLLVPTVGYELCDSDESVLLELELAWENNKVGVVINDDDQYWDVIQNVQTLGWQVFTVDELDDSLDQFLACFN